MIVGRLYLFSFVLVTLIALQQSGGTHSVRRPGSPPAAGAIGGRVFGGAVGKKSQLAGKTAGGGRQAAKPDAGHAAELFLGDVPTERYADLSTPELTGGSFPESLVQAPETELASRLTKYDTLVRVRASGAVEDSAWEYRQNQQGKIVGFEFSNRGGNPILTQRYNIDKNWFFTRDFQFRFDDRARQDIHLSVTDWAPSRDKQFRLSELMNSVMHFFPRTYVPAITSSGGRSIVTLPTGEAVEFDARTYEILGGVFAEAPVDLNPDKTARRFAGIHYVGRGLVVRADARGTDPRLGTTATISVESPAEDCRGAACKSRCRVPSQELWEQKGAVRFKYASDEEFDRYLTSRCGFGIPKIGSDSLIASAANRSPPQPTDRLRTQLIASAPN
jgi:hypothetical protein